MKTLQVKGNSYTYQEPDLTYKVNPVGYENEDYILYEMIDPVFEGNKRGMFSEEINKAMKGYKSKYSDRYVLLSKKFIIWKTL